MFVRAGATPAAPAAGPGTRPGPGGTPVLSTGVAGLDAALRGGTPTGRVLLLETAPSASAADSLVRLFVAEGVACGHAVTWVCAGAAADDDGAWWLPAERAPRNRSSHDDATTAPAAADLKIAWQYRRYIAAKSAAGGDNGASSSRAPHAPGASAGALPAWCHDFDLKTRVDASATVSRVGGVGGDAAAAGVEAAVLAARSARAPAAPPARIVLVLPSAPAWLADGDGFSTSPAASVIALRRVRGAVRGSRACVLALSPPGALHPSHAASARSAADAVLTLAPLRSDGAGATLLAARRDAVGLLTIATPPRSGAGYARPPPSAPLYVVTRRGGRLAVREAEVDPDAESEAGAAAAVACGGGSKSNALDF